MNDRYDQLLSICKTNYYDSLNNCNYRRAFCINQIISCYLAQFIEFDQNEKNTTNERNNKLVHYVSNDSGFFKQISTEIDSVFTKNYKHVLNSKYKLNTLHIGIHIDIANELYCINEFDQANAYVLNVLELYAQKYNGLNSFEYQQFLCHLIGEVLQQHNILLALDLYKNNFNINVLKDYFFISDTLLLLLVGLYNYAKFLLNENEKKNYFFEMYQILETWKSFIIKNDISLQIDADILYHFHKLYLLEAEKRYKEAIDFYDGYIDDSTRDCPLFPMFCLELGNCYLGLLNQERANYWVDEGYIFSNELSEKDDIYYKLCKLKSFFEIKKNNYVFSIKLSKIALEGFKNLGDIDNYFATLLQLYIFSRDENEKEDYWNQIVDISNAVSKEQLCIMYINLVSSNYNYLGEFSINYKKLQSICEKAISLAEEIKEDYLIKIAKINYLKVLILNKCYEKDKIKDLFNEFDVFFKERKNQNNDYYFLYILCKLLFYDFSKDYKNIIVYDKFVRKNVFPQLSDSYKIIYDSNYRNLDYCKQNSIKNLLRRKDQLEDYSKKIYNHLDMQDFINETMYFFSFINDKNKDIIDIFPLISKLKYLKQYYYGNYMDKPSNRVISKHITSLETRYVYQNISNQEKKYTLNKINELKEQIKYNYSLKTPYHIPGIDMIHIPDNSCYIDFFLYYTFKNNELDNEVEVEKFYYMIHIVEKLNNGQMIVKCENIIDADILVEYIDKYYDTFSDEILVNIYNILFNDIQHIIKKYTTVYISANGFLSEFSFDFFNINENTAIFEDKTLIYVPSIYDIKPDFRIRLRKSTLYGNPNFNINKSYNDDISHLYLTEIEVQCIAKLLSSYYFTENRANKRNLINSLNSTMIHISTHGIFEDDENIQNDDFSLVKSAIVLSGFINWKNNEKLREYDNGILTAKEITFFDLSNVDLMVLSACRSAQGSNMDFSYQGVNWSLGFSGCKSTITSLFDIDEALSAIFMIIFYNNLKKYPVAEALTRTKKYCFNLSITNLRKVKYFNYILNQHEKINNVVINDMYPFQNDSCIYSFKCTFFKGKT